MHEELWITLVFFAVVFGIVFVIISARNRERMAMIEKDVNPKDFIAGRPSAYGILKWALLLAGLGLGVFFGSILETYTQIQEEPAYFGSTLFFGGLGLLVAFLITKNAEEKS